MGLLLFRAFLVINAFNIATENPVTPNPYRFPVYSVNKCPRSENEFKKAAQRRNCTRGLRYLCVPNKYISSLLEFCTDRLRGLYGKGNCVLLEGTGDLDHYSCEEKFNSSCPSEPYYDEDIFKYPACLEIDKELRCFVADNNCNKRELSTIETPLNISKMETVRNETFRSASPRLLAIVYIIAVVSAGMILIWVIFQKRRKEQGERYKNKDENKSLLKDPEPPIEQNDDVQLDQTAINVFKNIHIQTTSTETVSETVKKDTQTSKTIQREEKRKEESVYKPATSDGKQQHNSNKIEDAHMTQEAEKSKMDWESSYSDMDVPKPKYYAPKKRPDPKPRPVYQGQVAVPIKIYGRSGEEGSKENEEEWPVVVALDFGTTYSGYAFWRKENPSEITTGKWTTRSKEVMESLKTPTSLLLNQNNKVIEFGYKADEIFKELVENEIDKEYRYFRQFKMMLHNESLLDKKKSISDHLKRPLEALEVFSLSIQYLRDECLEIFDKKRIKVDPDEILWILTVPAICGESAKQFMRKAAEKAGILSEQLILALEPEAAAIYVMKEAKTVFGKDTGTTFNPGTKFMVADLGGGTADLIVLEVKEDRKMKQLHQSAGGAWDGSLINKKIWEIMAELFGSNVIEDFKKTSDFMEMESIIELRKIDININIGSKLQLPVLPSLSQLCKQDYRTLIKNSIYGNSVKARTGKLNFEPDMVQKIFDPTLTNLLTVVEKVLNHENAVGVNIIILVGGLAQADFIVKQFKETFSGYKVIVPIDPVLAVLKGAVMFGQDTDIISSRITAHTYGFDAMRFFMRGDPRGKKRKIDNVHYCVEVFEKMVAIGDSVDVGKTVEKEVFASSKEMKSMVLKFYQSEIKNPKYVTDPGCKCIGKLSVEMPDLSGGTERSVMVSIKFGETEITVCGVDKTTGKKQETALDLLGDTK